MIVMLVVMSGIMWIAALRARLSSSYPFIRFPMTKYLFLIVTLNPNEDVRHEAGIRIDSLDPLIHRFPDGPESADLSVDSLEDDGLNGFVEIVSLIKFRVSDGSCISSLIKSKGSGVGLADLIIRRSLSVK